MKLTLEVLINHLGEPEKKVGAYYFWQCPYCRTNGGDDSRDNLKFDERNNSLWCYACPEGEHSKAVLRDIYKNNKNLRQKSYKKPIKPTVDPQIKFKYVFSKEGQDELFSYMHECNKKLLAESHSLSFLLKKRGITKETVKKTGLGIDRKNQRWTIPTFSYNSYPTDKPVLLGFEYRPLDLSSAGIHRSEGTPTGMAMINCRTSKAEILCVVEGYFDGYALLQYLTEQGQSDFCHIVTPPNGINSLQKYIRQIDFYGYRKYCLYVDNDNVSNAAASKILEKYPMFERITMSCDCKDFNEHYLKCIKLKT